jgi:hypothetical protein
MRAGHFSPLFFLQIDDATSQVIHAGLSGNAAGFSFPPETGRPHPAMYDRMRMATNRAVLEPADTPT